MANEPATPPARLCVLTPESRGAVAVVRIWGPGALTIADAAFRPARGKRLAVTPPDRPRFGRLGAGSGDEVVAVVIGGETPEVEIHCHGGPAPVALVVEALVALGAEKRQPAAWARHDARSTIEAEARVDLARAPTLRTAEILLEQAEGALEREVGKIARLVEIDSAEAIAGAQRLIRDAAVGRRLIDGWRVALAGRPNVGKSRLFNALAGFDRAIVDPTPGTTRDVVTVRTAFDGWPVELADTAGLRRTDDLIEAAGVALARTRHSESDLTILVLDRSEPLTDEDLALRDAIHAEGGMVVASKADLPAAWTPEDDRVLTVSAVRGDGIERLIAAVSRRLVLNPPEPGAGVPFRPSHARKLRVTLDALRAGDRDAVRASLTEWGIPGPFPARQGPRTDGR